MQIIMALAPAMLDHSYSATTSSTWLLAYHTGLITKQVGAKNATTSCVYCFLSWREGTELLCVCRGCKKASPTLWKLSSDQHHLWPSRRWIWSVHHSSKCCRSSRIGAHDLMSLSTCGGKHALYVWNHHIILCSANQSVLDRASSCHIM